MENIPSEIYERNETTFDWISQHDTVAPLELQSKRIDQIRVEINQLGLKVGSLEGDIGNLRGKLTSAQSEIDSLRKSFDKLESDYKNDISKFEQRLASLENNNNEFDTRFQSWIDNIKVETVRLPQGVSDNIEFLAKNGKEQLITDRSQYSNRPQGNWINRNGEFLRNSSLLDVTTYSPTDVTNNAWLYADFVETREANFLHETGREVVLKQIKYPEWQTHK